MDTNSPSIFKILPRMIHNTLNERPQDIEDTKLASIVDDLVTFLEEEWDDKKEGESFIDNIKKKKRIRHAIASHLMTDKLILHIVSHNFIETALRLCRLSEQAFTERVNSSITENGETALQIAFSKGFEEMASLLLKHASDGNKSLIMAANHSILDPENDDAWDMFSSLLQFSKTDELLEKYHNDPFMHADQLSSTVFLK